MVNKNPKARKPDPTDYIDHRASKAELNTLETDRLKDITPKRAVEIKTGKNIRFNGKH